MAKMQKKTTPAEMAAGQPVEGQQSAGESAPVGPEPAIGTPVVALEDYQKLQVELEDTRQKCTESFEGWQRERADFSNYKRRIERDQAQMSYNVTGEVVKKYLVILDDLERALKTRPAKGEGAAWSEGVELIYRKLQNILDAEGVSRIPAEGELFNPALHEAVTHEDSADYGSGQVIEVLQQGYKIGDRVLRPALVRVAR
jgi:molecular chaperone GrpE